MDLPRPGQLSQGISPLLPGISEAFQSPADALRFRAQDSPFWLRYGLSPELPASGRALAGSGGQIRTPGRCLKARGGFEGFPGSSKIVQSRRSALALVPPGEPFGVPGRASGGARGPDPSRTTLEEGRTSRPVSSKVLGGSLGARLGGTSISPKNGFSGRFHGPGAPDTGPPGVEPVGPEVWHTSRPNRTLRKPLGLRACPHSSR